MSRYAYPNENASPVGLDAKIKAINEALLGLPWLTTQYERVWRVPETADKRIKTKFKLLSGDDFMTIAKDDEINAFSFFVAEGPETPIDNGQKAYEREVGLIMVLNLPNVLDGVSYIATEEIKLQVQDILLNIDFAEYLRYHDNDPRRVFSGIDLENTGYELAVWPYAALRFDLKLTYGAYCI